MVAPDPRLLVSALGALLASCGVAPLELRSFDVATRTASDGTTAFELDFRLQTDPAAVADLRADNPLLLVYDAAGEHCATGSIRSLDASGAMRATATILDLAFGDGAFDGPWVARLERFNKVPLWAYSTLTQSVTFRLPDPVAEHLRARRRKDDMRR